MKKINHVALCPQCSVAMAIEAPAMCTACGWVSLGEIKRQISYWNQRLLAAAVVKEPAS